MSILITLPTVLLLLVSFSDAFLTVGPLKTEMDTLTTRFADAAFLPSNNTDIPSYTRPADNFNHVDDDLPRQLAAVFHVKRPLTDKEKKGLGWLVHGVKHQLFDRFFAEKSVERSYARFYALETIARIPFFSFLSVLHMFETLGWWRHAELLQLHFEESWNELHHLMIMEELGGEKRWSDRFLAQHVSCFYYWMVVVFYLVNPLAAYHFNELVEQEAYDTYDKFLGEYGSHLKEQPAPKTAVKYYGKESMNSLYDCFVAIRNDEAEHCQTMKRLQCWK